MVEIKKSKLLNSDIRKKINSFKKPVLKIAVTHKFTKKLDEFDDVSFNFSDFSKLDYDSQTKLFNAIKETFANLKENAGVANNNTYEILFYNSFTEVLELAVAGNVAAMDYLCFLYKRGVEHFLPINMVMAHEWGMLAVANGSKLAVDRMRLFLEPVFEYVVEADVVDKMIEKNNIPEGEGAYFVAMNFAEMYINQAGISLLAMTKKNPLDDSINFQVYLREAEKKREEVLPQLLRYLV